MRGPLEPKSRKATQFGLETDVGYQKTWLALCRRILAGGVIEKTSQRNCVQVFAAAFRRKGYFREILCWSG